MKNYRRAIRRHHTQRVQRNRVEQAAWDVTPQMKGYYKKHGVGDCGRARCGLCHHEKRRNKYVNRKYTFTLQELKIAITEHEFLNDV